MYLIIGLGNPEPEYCKTRHNMGFDVINEFAKRNKIKINKSKFNALYGKGEFAGKTVMLIKPQTYMNLSGKSVVKFVKFYKEIDNIIVIYDDIDIEPENIKIRKKGGSGTHNGMKSVVQELQTENFARIRVGRGNSKYSNDLINHVIGKVSDEEYKVLQNGIQKAVLALEEIVKSGIDLAMNKFN